MDRHMRHLLFFFKTRTGLASHSGKNTSMMKSAARSRAISSPTTLLFSSDKRRKGCLTGFASDRTCNLCSANSVGTPGMSLGDHAKMSRFSRRKSASSPSYLLSRFVPMTAYLSGCSGSKGMFFVSLAGLNDPSASDSLGSVTSRAACRPSPQSDQEAASQPRSPRTRPADCYRSRKRTTFCSRRPRLEFPWNSASSS